MRPVLILLLYLATAASVTAEEPVTAFAPEGTPNPLKPLSQEQQAAYRKLIDISACAYTSPAGFFRFRVTPSIIRVPNACGDSKKPYAYQCYSTVYCINPVSGGFYLDRAVCPSRDGKNCPDAKACALMSSYDGSQWDRDYGLPVLKQIESESAQ